MEALYLSSGQRITAAGANINRGLATLYITPKDYLISTFAPPLQA
jgi:hypothetical protein